MTMTTAMTTTMTKSQASIRRNLWAGTAIALLMVGGVGVWGATTDIAGAVIAPGALVVDSNLRKVQHPTGGVIGEILARDGDRVKEGDVLVRLDATITRANLAIVVKSLDELRARKARLEAERDNRAGVAFPPQLTERRGDPDVERIMLGERRLFDLRQAARSGQKSQLNQRIVQLQREVDGIEAQAASKAQEIVLIQKELAGARDLWNQNLYPITKLTYLEREATRVAGERAQLVSSGAQARGKIAETELQIVQIDRDLASDVAKELRETDAKIDELLERQVAAEDQLKRIDIRAPIDGVVYQSTAHTVGGVIPPNGDPIMLIVPDTDRLIAEAKAAPQDIDQLHLGQPARVRFLAFNQRTTPEIEGTVSLISADAATDQRTGAAYYTIRVAFDPAQTARLGKVRLVPGMPIEAFVSTGDRKVISYLMKPLADQFARAMREQ
jgi:HlyD family secretion protein